MKRLILVITAAVIGLFCFSGCGSSTDKDSDKISIVTTIFPEYDWVKAILGKETDSAEVTMLLDNGVDLHSYQPTADDIVKISSCDMFIYVGGESDGWVEDALKEKKNDKMEVINLLELLGSSVKEEEVVEGMQAEEEEDEEEEETEYDEHVWLSLKNAKTVCSEIADRLCKLDSSNADKYKKNLADYTSELDKLDSEYQQAVSSAKNKTVLFGDRFPFRYLTDDYGLNYYAAFVGCSAETEASFETVLFLAQKIDELSLPAVLTIDKSDQSIAKTIVDNTKNKDQQILTIDSMQSKTSEDVKNGDTYLSVMKSDLDVLKQALK